MATRSTFDSFSSSAFSSAVQSWRGADSGRTTRSGCGSNVTAIDVRLRCRATRTRRSNTALWPRCTPSNVPTVMAEEPGASGSPGKASRSVKRSAPHLEWFEQLALLPCHGNQFIATRDHDNFVAVISTRYSLAQPQSCGQLFRHIHAGKMTQGRERRDRCSRSQLCIIELCRRNRAVHIEGANLRATQGTQEPTRAEVPAQVARQSAHVRAARAFNHKIDFR